MMNKQKNTYWVGDSLKNIRTFPEAVKDSIGYALHFVQEGLKPNNAKLMKGFQPSVMEIVVDFDKNTYRAVYTVKIGNDVYVLHCFQKKSKTGIKTPKQDIDLIKERLKDALAIHQSNTRKPS